MKKQNIIGLILIAAGAILLWFASDYAYSNYAAYLGYVTGQTAIFSLIALLFIALTPYRKEVGIVLVIGAVWLGSTTLKSIELYEHGVAERKTGKRMISMIDSLQRGEEVAPPLRRHEDITTNNSLENDEQIIADFFQDYFSRVQILRNEYLDTVAEARLDLMLSPEHLADSDIAKQSKAKIAHLAEYIEKHHARTIAEIDRVETELLAMDSAAGRAAYGGFLKSKHEGIETTNKYYENQTNIINTVNAILDLAINNSGKLHLQDGMLLFAEQSTLDQYNELITILASLGEQEEQILQGNQNRLDSIKSNMNDML